MYLTVTRKKYKDTYHEQILLRESYREDGKVKTRTIANITNQPKHQIEALAVALKTKKDEPLFNTSTQKQGYTIGLSLVILFIAKLLGILSAIGKTNLPTTNLYYFHIQGSFCDFMLKYVVTELFANFTFLLYNVL